jgi:hypothetical protein
MECSRQKLMKVDRFGWFCDHGDQTLSIWQLWVLSIVTFQSALKTSSPVAFGVSSRQRQLETSFTYVCTWMLVCSQLSE